VRYGMRADATDITAMFSGPRAAGFGDEVKRRIMLGTYALSAGYYDAYYGQAQRVRTLIIRDFEEAYRGFDALLAPTTPGPAFELGAKTQDPLAMYMSDVCTIPSNLTGQPAISVPWWVDQEPLPLGVQVMAPPLGEAVMVRVAAAVEAAAPRSGREGTVPA
jgi:aspartyl-tRNA(Asn)/glutamyl-tRNA(Gln) amidotransferase subunit A